MKTLVAKPLSICGGGRVSMVLLPAPVSLPSWDEEWRAVFSVGPVQALTSDRSKKVIFKTAPLGDDGLLRTL